MSKFRDIFRGKRFVTVRTGEEPDTQSPKKEVPDGLWTKCPGCRTLLYNKDLERNLFVCDKCGHHFPLSASERLAQILDDPDAFEEIDADLVTADPLDFPQYAEKLGRDRQKTGRNDAITTGVGSIGGQPTVVAVMDFAFMGGSMGAVVGERITRAFEYAIERELPVVTVSASGGARMQEGILSLMQMQKTAAAVWRHSEKGLLYISVLTHPTTAGVFGSFASLGDVNISEPGATVGFAGQRVIEETIRKAVPTNLQKAETVFENGFIDNIVPRTDLRDELVRLIVWHTETGPIEVRKKDENKEGSSEVALLSEGNEARSSAENESPSEPEEGDDVSVATADDGGDTSPPEDAGAVDTDDTQADDNGLEKATGAKTVAVAAGAKGDGDGEEDGRLGDV